MPEEGDNQPDRATNTETAPIDSDILDRISRRLRGSDRFETVDYQPEYAPTSVVFVFDLGYFPNAVERASLHVRWYENDDFNIHYAEQHRTEQRWECRWDRHPNTHNSREQFHPPPDATTPGTDETYSDDWREVLTQVLERLDSHIEKFWE